MDLSFLVDFMQPVILGICVCLGFVIKKWVKDVDNKFIPTINAVVGIFLAIWMGGWTITPAIILGGLVSGLAATGAYEAIRNYKVKPQIQDLTKDE